MAHTVNWSATALGDLEAVTAFIAKDSRHYAASFVREVLQASSSLTELNSRGRIVPEFGLPSIRELFVRDYRLIYRIGEMDILVLGFIHGSRDLAALWPSRPASP